nr:MarR family transcriptional regulator [uncultured Methanolobus sp.]
MTEKTEMEFSFEKLDEYYNRLLKEYELSGEFEDISHNAYMYIRKIHLLGTPSLSELARSMEVTKPSASAMVHKLSDKKLLTISPSETDKRVTLLNLTDKGVRFIEFQDFADKRIYTRIREVLDDNEFSLFSELWRKIDANLDATINEPCDLNSDANPVKGGDDGK